LQHNGYTQAELDALLTVLEDSDPRTPSKTDKKDAERSPPILRLTYSCGSSNASGSGPGVAECWTSQSNAGGHVW
jgi:hypothetical protein